MSELFFMKGIQLTKDQVLKVTLLPGLIGVYETHLPRVVVNGSNVFEGDEGVEAIRQLKSVGFYDDEQYEKVSSYFNDMLAPINKQLTRC